MAPSAALDAPESSLVNESVTLDASGSTGDGDITEYRWDFEGDGTVDATTPTATVTHSYPVAGDYEPTVTVVDASNRTDEATATLSIESRSLSASLNVPDSPAVNESVTLDASGSAPAELITEYRWDFEGDGTVDLTTSGPTAEHVYAAPGTYDPTVTVVNASNGTASASTSVTVGSVDQPPSAALNAPATASINESVTLDASGSTDDVGITEYRWDFEGDGTVDATTPTATVAHAYSAPGTYEPTVTVVDSSGRTASATVTLTAGSVDEPPSAALAVPNSVTVNESVTLDASGSTDDGGITEYRWDFDGDGTVDATTSNAIASYVYAALGSYQPTVTVVDTSNQTNEATRSVDVIEQPIDAEIRSTPADPVPGQQIDFTAVTALSGTPRPTTTGRSATGAPETERRPPHVQFGGDVPSNADRSGRRRTDRDSQFDRRRHVERRRRWR